MNPVGAIIAGLYHPWISLELGLPVGSAADECDWEDLERPPVLICVEGAVDEAEWIAAKSQCANILTYRGKTPPTRYAGFPARLTWR